MNCLSVYGTTRTGLIRRSNEDHILLVRSLANRGSERLEVPASEIAKRAAVLCAVADGIGGEAGGAVASRLALAALDTSFHAVARPSGTLWELASTVRSAAEQANDAVLEAAIAEPRLAHMGCTLTGVCIHPDGYLVFNAGDSRVYRYCRGSLDCLTRDDSMASLVVEAGAMTAEEAARSPIGHTLTNSLGSEEFQLTVQEHGWRAGDRLLVCSDGLYDMVSNRRIRKIMNRQASLEQQSKDLVKEALANGGRDNISVILVQPPEGGAATPQP